MVGSTEGCFVGAKLGSESVKSKGDLDGLCVREAKMLLAVVLSVESVGLSSFFVDVSRMINGIMIHAPTMKKIAATIRKPLRERQMAKERLCGLFNVTSADSRCGSKQPSSAPPISISSDDCDVRANFEKRNFNFT